MQRLRFKAWINICEDSQHNETPTLIDIDFQ